MISTAHALLRVSGSNDTDEDKARHVARLLSHRKALRGHDTRSPSAAELSPGHHAHLAHVASLRTLREHGYATDPATVAQLVEQGRQQAIQAQQDAIWQASAVRQRSIENLARIQQIATGTGWWRGLWPDFGTSGRIYGLGTVCQTNPFGQGPVHS